MRRASTTAHRTRFPPESSPTRPRPDFPKDAETYVRWLQVGVFSSHVRAHGKQPHEPWTYGARGRRHRPHLPKAALPAAAVYSILRPSDVRRPACPWCGPWCWNSRPIPTPPLSTGISVRRQPVGRSRVASRQPLPRLSPGRHWVDYWTKQIEPGGRWLDVESPLDKLPLWVRAGDHSARWPRPRICGPTPA